MEQDKELLIIKEVENKVAEITKFDVTKQQLEEKVEETKQIVATDLSDQTQLALVKRNRIDLREIEISIEKRGKGYRDIFTKANRYIKDKENELLAVTNPEIERLKSIEKEAEELRILEERKLKLPERMKKIESIGDKVETPEEDILSLDDDQFERYYNARLTDKLEQDKLEMEAEKQRLAEEAEEKRLAEQAKLDAERKAIEAEAEEKRLAEQARIDAENARLVAEQKKIDDANAEIARKEKEAKDKDQMAKEAQIEADRVAKLKVEEDERKKKELEAEQARQLALKPDKEKLALYADALVAVKQPELNTEEARNILANTQVLLSKVTKQLRK
uniref:Uncharacterized protein n=2 Tax=viral metagenome TaxID=1070528 RepID=A0A6H1ZSY4_9ZZZZ